jgi:tetratricopeptide (TPR) repeat protein
MNPPKPRTICAALIDELANAPEAELSNELFIAGIVQKAQKGKDQDPEHYLNVMGIVSSLRGQHSETDEYFQRCLNTFGGSFVTYFNYAQSLQCLDRSFDALGMINKALAIAPTTEDAVALESLIQGTLIDNAWADMEHDTEEQLIQMCQHQMVADL